MKYGFTLLTLFIGFIAQAQVTAYPPEDLIECDDNTDGFAVFDLTQTYEQILFDQDPLEHLIFFYETQMDADLNLNPIVNDFSYINITNPQTIFARLEHAASGNYDTTFFDLMVAPMLEIGSGPYTIELCDDWINGSTGDDEISTFDLTGLNDDITLGNSNLSVRFYETLADQNAGDYIINPDMYQNIVNPQTIYVSVFNELGCESRTHVTITVLANPSPNPNPDELVICDDDNDGTAEFMLTDLDAEIINGEPGVTIRYYETFLQAVNGYFEDQMNSPYVNVINPQIIYARVEYDPTTGGTGCYTIVDVVLRVYNTPIISPITDYILFDNGDDGIEEFDLTTKIPEILNGQTNTSVFFFETELDAESFTNPIIFPEAYVNNGSPQPIYVGLLDDSNICYSAPGNFDLVLDTTIGFNDNIFSDLIMSPNPASEIVKIQSSNFSSETQVVLYNIQGQVVLSEVKNSATGNFIVNVSNLTTGMYFMQIQSEGASITKKLIKQ